MSRENHVDRSWMRLTEGETLKNHPIIQSAANRLSSQFSNVIIDDEEVAEIAATLADFQKATGASNEVIQNALIAAESQLSESWEGYYHTY